MNKIEIRANLADYGRYVNILICQVGFDGGLSVAKTVALEPIIDGDFIQPTLNLKTKEAQALMDSLWQCGLRPTEGAGSAGSLAATERHLKDMQTIAMGLLKSQL